MKLIALHGQRGEGHFAIVDDADFDVLSRWRWHLGEAGYAMRHGRRNGRNCIVRMHRQILEVEDGPRWLQVDHIDGNGLDNRRCNLRLASNAQNSKNMRLSVKNTSGYKGVRQAARSQVWVARITCNYKEIYLGCFPSKEEAARAYNEAALKLFGQFAKLNAVPSIPKSIENRE